MRHVAAFALLSFVASPALAGSCSDRSVAELQLMTRDELDQEFCIYTCNEESSRKLATIQRDTAIKQRGLDAQMDALNEQKAMLGAVPYGGTGGSATDRTAQEGRDNEQNAERCSATLKRIRLVLRSRFKLDAPECDDMIVKSRATAPAKKPAKKP